MPSPAGWSQRTTCADCGEPTDHTRLCGDCRRDDNAKRAKKRAEWKEEGRCVTCSRIVLEENKRTGELYSNCRVCRRRRSLKGYGKTTEEINRALREIGGRPPNPNAAPPGGFHVKTS
jgi:DNA-directed RNA polymerase subunit RPC12/RpoP